jgi:hypothetical protein
MWRPGCAAREELFSAAQTEITRASRVKTSETIAQARVRCTCGLLFGARRGQAISHPPVDTLRSAAESEPKVARAQATALG